MCSCSDLLVTKTDKISYVSIPYLCNVDRHLKNIQQYRQRDAARRSFQCDLRAFSPSDQILERPLKEIIDVLLD